MKEVAEMSDSVKRIGMGDLLKRKNLVSRYRSLRLVR